MTQHIENEEQSSDRALVAETSAREHAEAWRAWRADPKQAPPIPGAPHPPKSPAAANAAGLSALEGRGEFAGRPSGEAACHPVGATRPRYESDAREEGARETRGAGMGEGLDELISRRGETHGSFDEVAEIARSLKDWLRHGSAWSRLSPIQREALESKATKLARIVCGDPNFPDHWLDDAGYTWLVLSRLP